MPSYHRGIDDESLIWRIDVESDYRPSKRQRTAITEKFDCDGIGSTINRKAACSFEEEDMDASSSLESSSDMMTIADRDHESVETILQNHIRVNSEIEFLKEGLDKLLKLIGAKNNNSVSKQRHRLEMLDLGGHWMITNLLVTLTQEDELEHNANMDVMDDEDVSSANNTAEVDDERVVAVVGRCCQILREILLINPAVTDKETIPSRTINNMDVVVRYQVYCAGGLDAVVSALKRFPTSFEIQMAGCQCLAELVSFKGSNDMNSKGKGMDANGTDGRININPTTTLIKNLYQSTDRLNVIVRLVSAGIRKTLQNGTGTKEMFLSNTQIWQLYFVVAEIVRTVVRHSSIDSSCRSEVIRMIEKYFFYDGGCSCHSASDTMVVDNMCDNEGDSGVRYFHRSSIASRNSTCHINGIGRHMYEHLMTILVDEEDSFNTDAASISMNE